MVAIVVARYTEDVEWTKQFPNVTIYNKGPTLGNDYPNVVEGLENVGREGHTYYKHIYDNYDNLDDYTIFLQGNPFDHSPNIINDIHTYINSKELTIDFEFLTKNNYNCSLAGCYIDPRLPIRRVYETLFGETKDNVEFIFGAGAQFIVSKHAILKKPKSFYLKIIEMLQTDINPFEGFVIERLHKVIFMSNFE
jgi:hypothetical protein